MVSTDEMLALANTTVWMDNFFIPYWRGYKSLLNIYMGFQQGGGMVNFPGELPIDFSPYTCPEVVADARMKQPCAQPGGVGVGGQMNPTTVGQAWAGEREYDPRNRGWYIKSTRQSMTGKVQYSEPYINAWSTERQWLLSLSLAVYKRLTTGGYDESATGLVGVLSTDLTIDSLQKMINQKKFQETGFASLVNPAGELLATPSWDPDTWAPDGWDGNIASLVPPKVWEIITDENGKGITEDLFKTFTDPTTLDTQHIFEYEIDTKQDDGTMKPQTWILARTPVPPKPTEAEKVARWSPKFYVFVHVDKSKVEKSLTQMRTAIATSSAQVVWTTVGFSLLTLLVTACIIRVITTSLTRPLAQMVKVADMISNHDGSSNSRKRGDLAQEVNMIDTPDDIIGALVKEFKTLVLGLNNKDAVAASIIVDDTVPEENKYYKGKRNVLRNPATGKFIWEEGAGSARNRTMGAI